VSAALLASSVPLAGVEFVNIIVMFVIVGLGSLVKFHHFVIGEDSVGELTLVEWGLWFSRCQNVEAGQEDVDRIQ
jgi:hypothetical protein